MTAIVSRPSSTDAIASRCPGRSASKPNASCATRSIRSVVATWRWAPRRDARGNRRPARLGRRGRRSRRPPLGVELPGGDRGRHVLGLLAVDRAVLELDHGVLALPAELLRLVPLARAQRALDDLVRD